MLDSAEVSRREALVITSCFHTAVHCKATWPPASTDGTIHQWQLHAHQVSTWEESLVDGERTSVENIFRHGLKAGLLHNTTHRQQISTCAAQEGLKMEGRG